MFKVTASPHNFSALSCIHARVNALLFIPPCKQVMYLSKSISFSLFSLFWIIKGGLLDQLAVWMSVCRSVWSDKLLLALATTVSLGFGSRRDPWPYIFSKTFTCLCVCVGKMLLVLASTVILGFESRRTHGRILLSRVSGSHATDRVSVLVGSGRVGSGKLLLALASTVILGFESRGIYDHVLLSYDSESSATLLCLCTASKRWTRRFLCGPCRIKGK
jgi:hypothetical protein